MHARKAFSSVVALVTAFLTVLPLGAESLAQSTLEVPTHSASASVAPFKAGTTRLSGPNRYATAVSVAQRYSQGVDAVFVATGSNFPDALSAAAAAASMGAPLLLSEPRSLPKTVRD